MDRALFTGSGVAASLSGRRPAAHAALIGGYIATYVFLDWLSYIHPAGPYAITLWNPPPGLSLALLLGFGFRYAPALFVAAALAEIAVRHGQTQIGEAVLYAAILAIGYTGLAILLKRLRFDPSFRSLRDLVLFVGVAGAGSIVIATLYVAAHVATGQFPWSAFAAHIVYFWIGDVIGMATTTPFLLIHGARLANGRLPKITFEAVLQALSIAAVLALIFHLEPQRAANLFYLLFIPVVWIATRYGFEGAITGLLAAQLGLIATVQLADYPSEWVLQFQFLMLALTITGAFLGMASSQWRRARKALENREAELRTIFATAPDAIISLDGGGSVMDGNDAAREMFGMSAAELKERRLSQLMTGIPADISNARGIFAQALRSDGRAFPVEASFGSVEVEGRSIHIGVVRDVAERKAMEDKLRERDQYLDRALRVAAAAEMASALAHELNQPLTAATAYVQSLELLLARGAIQDAGVADTMRKTAGEVERAGNIVRRLREFYRRDPGEVVSVPVREVIDTALAPLQDRLERHRIAVEIEVAAGTPDLLVDALQIEMVLHNVLRNAVDSLAESEAPVRRIAVLARPGEAGYVAVSVEDSGPGVRPEMAEQIFKSFVTSRGEGSGLGLAISRSIVERHGGHLWLDPSPVGARFVITLPAART
jgi:two-component system sensor kinase FixL